MACGPRRGPALRRPADARADGAARASGRPSYRTLLNGCTSTAHSGRSWTADVAAHLDRALGQDTAEQWALVVEGWETLGAPIEAALATLRLAERLAQDGERDRAAATASSALATAERLGALALADRIRAAARRHRLRLDGVGSDDDGAHGLTAREREVLMLLAEGRTNEQIAAGLFMSPKTASVHVSRIITKLGVANRTEAAAYAAKDSLHRTISGAAILTQADRTAPH